MSEPTRCNAGDWVEVESILLEPADRAASLPEETAEKPLMMWVKGFAAFGAGMGETVEVETMTGRKVTGKLTDVNPGYFHTFGRPVAAIVHVGRDLRARVAEYHAAAPKAGE